MAPSNVKSSIAKDSNKCLRRICKHSIAILWQLQRSLGRAAYHTPPPGSSNACYAVSRSLPWLRGDEPQAIVQTREWNVRIVLVRFVAIGTWFPQLVLDQSREINHLAVNRLIGIVLISQGVSHEDSPVCE